MSMEVLEALACIAEIERKIDNLFRHGPVTERKRIEGAGRSHEHRQHGGKWP